MEGLLSVTRRRGKTPKKKGVHRRESTPREGRDSGPPKRGRSQRGRYPGPCWVSTHSALRATPSPEVTELICRLPLPTLSCLTRGCSPWRPVAVSGTALRKPARGPPAKNTGRKRGPWEQDPTPSPAQRTLPDAREWIFKGSRGGDGRAVRHASKPTDALFQPRVLVSG